MGRRLLILVVGLALCAAPWLAWASGDRDDERPAVTVAGHAVVQKTADQAVLDVGMVVEAPTAEAAARRNAELTAAVKAALTAGLGAGDRLETSGYDISAQTQWDDQNKVNRLLGYRASHTMRLTTGDPDRLGALLDTAVKAGANDIRGPNWQLADPAAARAQAQAQAVADAQAQAQVLAKAAGLGLGQLRWANAAGVEAGPRPMRAAMAAPREAASTSLAPGRVTVEANVICTFALIPAR